MPPRRGLSGYCGVTKIRVGKWRAWLNLPGRQVNLGQFDTKEVAAAAHDRAARYHLGQRYEFCNYASEMDTENATREASEIATSFALLPLFRRGSKATGSAAYCRV
jgi:hypothetical protein